MEGGTHLFTTPDFSGFLVTQILVSPYSRKLHVWLASNVGDGDRGDFFEQLKSIAAENNCDTITFVSDRAGWKRVFPGVRATTLYSFDGGIGDVQGGSTKTKETRHAAVQLPAWMSSAGKICSTRPWPTAPRIRSRLQRADDGADAANQAQASGQAPRTSGAGQGQVAPVPRRSLGHRARRPRRHVNFDSAAADRYMSPYLQDVQQRTVADMMRTGQMQMDDLGDSAAANHAFGGTRQASLRARRPRASTATFSTISRSRTRLAYENAQGQFNTDTDRQLGASTTNAGLDQQELDRRVAAGAALGNLGQQASGVNSEGIMNLLGPAASISRRGTAPTSRYNEFLRMQDGSVSRDQDIMSILAGTPRNVTTNTSGTTKSTQNPGWLNTALGAVSMARRSSRTSA
jgi:hypothetical protein